MGRTKKPSYLHIGVDVSQHKLAVAFRTRTGEVSEVEFSNDPAGVQGLVRLARAGKTPRRVVVESTGVYSLAVCLGLSDAGVEVMMVNPLASRRFAEAAMTRAKTDRVDARCLLEFAERMAFVRWTPTTAGIRQLRSIAGQILALVEQRTADLNRKHAAGVDPSTPTAVTEDLDHGIQELEKRIVRLLAAAKELINSDEDLTRKHRILVSVPGIADRSALQLLSHLAVLPTDMTPRQVVAFAGLDPRTVQSGTSVHGASHISRRGSRALRNALYMPVLVGVQFDPSLKAAYQTLVDHGKPKQLAQVAIMRRLLQALWQMLQKNQAWDPSKFGAHAKAA